MRFFLLFLFLTALRLSAFELNSVIAPVLRDLPEPELRAGLPGPPMAVSSASEKAQAHVRAGVAMLHSAWDFEAYRHFAAAAQEDPECLLAYWGIVMSLSGSANEFRAELPAALDRMLDLLEAEKGTKLEQGYAYAVAKLKAEGPLAAAKVYEVLAEDFPNERLARLWAAFLKRDGYDEFGKPRLNQEKAVAEIRDLLLKHPEDHPLTAFWLLNQAEMPFSYEALSTEGLPLARRLARLHPDFPPYLHLAGHYEWRCGNAKRAAVFFDQAATAYEAYMEKNGLSFYDCPGWVRSQVYLAAAWWSKGEAEKATAVFTKLARLEVSEERLYSAGGTLAMWEGRTLGARYLASGGEEADFKKGLELLGALPAAQWHVETSSASLYKDCLALYLGARRAVAEGNVTAAKSLATDFAKLRLQLVARQNQEKPAPSYSQWLRASAALHTLEVELEGLLALASDGATRKTALNWFRAAVERQAPASLLLPPALPDPMELWVGRYYLSMNEPEKAVAPFLEALRQYPNQLKALEDYRLALEKAGSEEKAQAVAERIKLVRE